MRVTTGIYRDRYSYRVVWPVHGKPKEKRFPLDAPIEKLKAWRHQRVLLASQQQRYERGGSFVRDVATFLRLRRGRPSFKSDRAHLRPWVHRFRHKSRWAIEPADCALAVADWQAEGYSAREIRHRVRLLRQLYHALDGATADTPVDDLDLPRVPKTRPLAVSPTVVRDVALELFKHERCRLLRNAKTRARYLVLATTGMRPAQVKRAQPIDLDLERRLWTVRPAKGDEGSVVYLNDDMLAAWQLFMVARAWGSFDTRSFAKTLRRCGWPKGIRPYNLRHTVGLTLSELGVDLGDIQAHMGHSNIQTTRQFYVPAVASRMKEASAKLDGRLPAVTLGPPLPSAMPTAMSAGEQKRKGREKAGHSRSGPGNKKGRLRGLDAAKTA